MVRLLIPLILAMTIAACGSTSQRQAPAPERPYFVKSVTPLADGTLEILATWRVVLPSGEQVKRVDMRERLQQAAAAECAPRPFALLSTSAAGLEAPKQGGLKVSYKGIVRCG